MDLPPGSDIAAELQLATRAESAQYDAVSKILHWTTVVLVLVQFGLAELWGFAPRPERHLMIVGHMSFGILLTAVLLIRIVWRVIPGHQVHGAPNGWDDRVAKAVHYALYALLGLQAVLGFVLRWAGDEAMSFFGLLIPPPFPPVSEPVQSLIGTAHNWVGWAIIIIAFGHALAALYHHFVLRDSVLRRML
jgi:cytochrome b561